MALKGTLKDFGIADILQLIGQQQKTGILHLKNRDEEVHVSFKDGNVVKAESTTRKKKELLGDMLVRAELINERQLQHALEEQRRTLRRLGVVLVASAAVTRERLREVAQLQTTETLYKLFLWKAGTYEFDAGEVEPDPEAPPLRSESVLMEGFRRVDEWPLIRRKITSLRMTFEKSGELPGAPAEAGNMDDALDAAFGDGAPMEKPAGVGANERRVFALVQPARAVQKIVDLARLGEFETCKALLALVSGGYLKALAPAHAEAGDEVGGFVSAGTLEKIVAGAGRLAVSLFILAGAIAVLLTVKVEGLTLVEKGSQKFADPSTQRFLSRPQLVRLRSALSVYEIEKGELPETLAALVLAGIVSDDDLRYPWSDPYYYRKMGAGSYVLLPPLR